MNRSSFATCVLAAMVAGCGPASPTVAFRTPHGGLIYAIPGGVGNVEVKKQQLADKPDQVQVVAYFLGDDNKPMANPPTSATIKPQVRGASPIELKPTGNSDPSNAGELASGGLPEDTEISGELSAIVEGKPVVIPINLR